MAGGPLQFCRACGDAVVVGNGRIRTLRAEPCASSRARQTGIRRDGRRKRGIRRKRRLEREDAGRNTMRRNGLGQGSHSSAVQFATRTPRFYRIRTTALQPTRTWRGRKQPDAIPIRAQGRSVGILARFIVRGKPQTREFWGRSPGFGELPVEGMRRTTFAAPAVSPDRRFLRRSGVEFDSP